MKILLPLFTVLILFACADKKPVSESAFIKLTIKNSLSKKVYLVAQVEDHYDTIADVNIVEGLADIPYSIKYPKLMYLQFDNTERPLPFYADEDGVEIDIETTASAPIVTISGSEFQDKFEEYQDIENAFTSQLQALQPLRVQALADQYIAEMLKRKEDSLYKKFMRTTLDFSKNSSIVGALIANNKIYDLTYAQADSIYQNIPAIYSRAKEVVLLKEKRDVLEKVDIGKTYTEINQKDTLGLERKLSDLVNENQYVLIDFWASWCQPCRRTNPALVSIYNDYHNKGFEILSVSLDEDGEEWKKAITEDQMPWAQVSQVNGFENQAAKDYSIVAIPQSILINKNGIIEVKNLNELDLREYLSEKL